MANYPVDPASLRPFLPARTELDRWQGETYVSLVGFQFRSTKLLGRFPIPFHSDFDEVNLRFYVRRKAGTEERRGVVFIAEVVPKRAIAATARVLYGENYVCLPMRNEIGPNGSGNRVEYHWRVDGQWCRIFAQTAELPKEAREGSLEQFITQHYWGFSRQRGGAALEYHVSHAPWKVWTTGNAGFEGEAGTLYGKDLGTVLRRRPDSAFVADGSLVIVFKGNRLQL